VEPEDESRKGRGQDGRKPREETRRAEKKEEW